MAQLKANSEISAFLEPIQERTEIINDHGIFLGFFVPGSDREEALYRHAATLFDPVGVDACLAADGPAASIGEIFQRLHQLAAD